LLHGSHAGNAVTVPKAQ